AATTASAASSRRRGYAEAVVPDPREIAVGDRVVFTALPGEWAAPRYRVPRGDRAFMKAMIARGRPARVFRIDVSGHPWIAARFRDPDGSPVHHDWLITEHTGWRRVRRRRG
ncbi:MAG TPA: hypothetical protein VJP77_06560, partial [Planctomycetota bacterium]|nr:hypothetical protein [Planctomycetota bacterium]